MPFVIQKDYYLLVMAQLGERLFSIPEGLRFKSSHRQISICLFCTVVLKRSLLIIKSVWKT